MPVAIRRLMPTFEYVLPMAFEEARSAIESALGRRDSGCMGAFSDARSFWIQARSSAGYRTPENARMLGTLVSDGPKRTRVRLEAPYAGAWLGVSIAWTAVVGTAWLGWYGIQAGEKFPKGRMPGMGIAAMMILLVVLVAWTVETARRPRRQADETFRALRRIVRSAPKRFQREPGTR